MEYAICVVAAAPVRKEPNHRSEMINQLLFGEIMQVLEEREEWFRITSLYDDYEGWLTYHLVTFIDEKMAAKDHSFIASSLLNSVTLPDQSVNAPMGSVLVGFNEETKFLWNANYKYQGTYRNTLKPSDADLLWKLIQRWINAPYLWGGKTFMGVDCSGFVQTVYKVLGIKLKRDAYQQATQGKAVEGLLQANEGDLAFFQNENGRIIHVGIVLTGNRIAHASGKVRMDVIDEKGIINSETGKRTHQLHSLRRMHSLCFDS